MEFVIETTWYGKAYRHTSVPSRRIISSRSEFPAPVEPLSSSVSAPEGQLQSSGVSTGGIGARSSTASEGPPSFASLFQTSSLLPLVWRARAPTWGKVCHTTLPSVATDPVGSVRGRHRNPANLRWTFFKAQLPSLREIRDKMQRKKRVRPVVCCSLCDAPYPCVRPVLPHILHREARRLRTGRVS